uniref:Uncharacterized protein n=1 Tax=Rhizophora mucronata TaxID=61149 RepID=A0A2P2NQQ8_RHIMU
MTCMQIYAGDRQSSALSSLFFFYLISSFFL